MVDVQTVRKGRAGFINSMTNTLLHYGALKPISGTAPLFQHNVLTKTEAFWIVALSALAAFVFFTNGVLLFTEFNNWALSAYATDFIKSSATEKYVMTILNTPNVLFTLIYMYMRDLIPFLNSYTLYKTILLACVSLNIYLLIKLSRYRSAYLVLLPTIFGYVLVGGMTHYYISLTIFFVALLLYESGRNSPLRIFVLALLAYHSHFMGFVSLMVLVLYKEGLQKTILYSIIPVILFVSYKYQYKYQYNDSYNTHFQYVLFNHFLSVRRILLPSMTDYHSNLYILLFSGFLNMLFCLYMAYMLFAGYFFPRDRKGFILLLGLLLIYFVVPASIAGSGINLQERLVIPFLAILIHVTNNKPLHRLPIVLFTGLVIVNIGLFHYYYEAKGPDYRNPLLNKEQTDFSSKAAQDILDGKPIDAINSAEIYPTGLVRAKK